MKKLFIFYSALIIIIVCIVNFVPNVTNNFLINSTEYSNIEITGAVRDENVYTVPSNWLILQVLNVAGISIYADTSTIDLYERVGTTKKIYVPYKIININTASIEALQTLDGVGAITAKNIYDYRSTTPFKKKEDLMNVVSASVYEKNKDRITI